jgi:branched-chain amino acid transport system permease protein
MTTVWSGLSTGAVYALVALGYNIVFIGSGTFNFAQASLTMLGVFLAYWGLSQMAWPVALVIVAAVTIVAMAAVTEERIAIRPVRQLQGLLVTTVGAATLITGIIEVVWGQSALAVPSFFTSAPLKVFGGAVLPDDLILIGLALVFTAAVALFGRYTMTGLAALAAAEDREAAVLRGVNARRFQIGAFAVAGALAGLLGPFLGPKTFASFSLGQSLAIVAFVALAIGGFGSIAGATFGAFAIGLVQAYTNRYIGGNYENLMVFAILLVVLLILPNGLFGRRGERVV